ncbi:helix-turn-helix domain-containing protein [Lentilactobacillus kisonensis]|uniref:Transcriptional regulator, AraC family n=2 Tax=Lentilactobacillus kisonensis TaxID=481722 RepID=H1LEH0_9LACO|nr:AraC family transcriptional regulator [Lentilactobacillus kisonensis]EHO52471.1 transcriptional regulator, AraC family [Lentilactobacillus kisonensis F0435]KRL22951.1 transcriptional regulator, AraC family [Lentilactobacillus kisonensis DSM 19906 = JCM 15041]
MTLEQLYISSLNIPAIEFKINDQQFDVLFKKGKILTNSYASMLKRIPKRDSFTVLCHTQTLFTFCFIKEDLVYLIGPEVINYNQEDKHLNLNSKIIYLSKRLNTAILEKNNCYQQILFFSQLIGLPIDNQTIDLAFQRAIPSRQLDDIITAVNFNDDGVHISYVYERALKAAIMLGDPSSIHSTFLALINSGRIGILSDKGRLRSVKNWGIICVSVTIRSAINAGIDYDQAYSLNDQYVRTIESLNAFDDVMNKIEEILKDMARRVQQLRNVHLSKDIRYIYQIILDSPEANLTVPELSNQLGLSSHYLSTLFKKEVDVSISRFKILVKINRVIQLISTTNLPLSEIAAKLNFADQAHLSRDFKALVGVCPMTARKNPHFTEGWNLYDFLGINVG